MVSGERASGDRYALTKTEIAQFRRDGYIGPFTLYRPAEMKQHLQALRLKLMSTRTAIYGGSKGASGVTNLGDEGTDWH